MEQPRKDILAEREVTSGGLVSGILKVSGILSVNEIFTVNGIFV